MKEKFRVVENPEIGELLTFKPNRNLPVYNWFHYKEGFSRDLVFMLLERFLRESKGAEKLVLDPFCGVGTTLLACREYTGIRGNRIINALGFDVLPVCVFVSRVKLRDYDVKELETAAKRLFKLKFTKPAINVPQFVRKYFSRFVLEDIVFFRERIREMESERLRDFFLLGLMNASMKCSYAFKDGACVKLVKKNVAPLREMFSRTVRKMIRDLKMFYSKVGEKKKCSTVVERCDARMLKLEDESVDFVITSPPYLNKIEYTEIYRIEHALFMEDVPLPAMRSFMGVREKTLHEDFGMIDEIFSQNFIPRISTPPANALPLGAKIYLKDLYLAVREMFRVCKPEAKVAIVLGDGLVRLDSGSNGETERYTVVDVLKCCAAIAEHVGFNVDRIVIANKRVATTPRRHKIEIMREGIILAEKR